MYCFRCGKELGSQEVNCPVCDAPQKRRQRRRHRLLVGLVIFISGAFVGSILDSFLFKGQSFEQSLFQTFTGKKLPSPPAYLPGEEDVPASAAIQPLPVATNVYKPPTQREPLEPDINTPLKPPPEMSEVPTAKHPPGVIPPPFISSDTKDVASTVPPEPISQNPGASLSLETPTVSSTQVTPKFTLSFKNSELLEECEGNAYHGSISPDRKVLLFSSNRPTGDGAKIFQCYFRDLNEGTSSARLFPWPGNVWTPEFSSDGRMLVFSSDKEKIEHIHLLDRLTQQVRQLTDGDSKNMMPAFSPDGEFIAFCSNRKGTNDIWMIGTDGTELVQVTSGPDDDREPRWWPDGRSIIFTRIKTRYKESNIMRVSLEPIGPPTDLIADQKRNWLADPSPNGNYIAFVRSGKPDGSENVIHVLNLESKKEFLVPPPIKGSEEYRPIWAPSGESILFHIERKEKRILYKANLDKSFVD